MTLASPAVVKAFDFLKWLLPLLATFPRHQRFGLAQRAQHAAFAVHEAFVRANAGDPSHVAEADRQLELLRQYLRLAFELEYVSVGQYEHASRLTAELGRLAGGWQRRIDESRTPAAPQGRGVGTGYRPAGRVLEQQPDQPPHDEPQQQHPGQP